MKKYIAAAFIILSGCSTSIKQFYPDSYFEEDNIYSNKTLRFAINYKSAWQIETDPNNMERGLKKIAKEFQDQGIELLYVGSTPDGLQGTQGVAANLNTPAIEYAEAYRDLNLSSMSADFGLKEMIIDGIPMVKWEYEKYGFHFAEFFFTLDTYNIRIVFWANPGIFKKFYKEYLSIMSSIDFVSRY